MLEKDAVHRLPEIASDEDGNPFGYDALKLNPMGNLVVIQYSMYST